MICVQACCNIQGPRSPPMASPKLLTLKSPTRCPRSCKCQTLSRNPKLLSTSPTQKPRNKLRRPPIQSLGSTYRHTPKSVNAGFLHSWISYPSHEDIHRSQSIRGKDRGRSRYGRGRAYRLNSVAASSSALALSLSQMSRPDSSARGSSMAFFTWTVDS